MRKDGAVRNESERNATRSGAGPVGGVPGVPANTPAARCPSWSTARRSPKPPAPANATDTESAVQRNYELGGAKVAVTSTRPGKPDQAVGGGCGEAMRP